jgi:hypothetical protein
MGSDVDESIYRRREERKNKELEIFLKHTVGSNKKHHTGWIGNLQQKYLGQ